MVLPGIAGTSPRCQSRTTPPGCAVSPGVSCCSGTLDQVLARAEVGARPARRARGRSAWKVSKSLLRLPRRVDRRGEGVHERVHVGGGQVVLLVPGGRRAARRRTAAWSTSSGSRRDSSRSSLPSGGSSRQVTSDGRGASGFSLAHARWSGCRAGACRKYSLPLAEEPNRLDRHSISVRGQFSGASTSSIAGLRLPSASASATYAAGVGGLARPRPRPSPRRPGPAGSRRTAGRTASSPAAADWAIVSAVCMPARWPSASGEASASAE